MTSPYGLAGRVAIVTGASRGIGLAVAEALVAAGARVCVTARGPEGVGRAVVWLASDAAEWVTGADLLVDGGTRVRAARTATTYAVHEQLRSRGSAPRQGRR